VPCVSADPYLSPLSMPSVYARKIICMKAVAIFFVYGKMSILKKLGGILYGIEI
jgi:hypothetical protein